MSSLSAQASSAWRTACHFCVLSVYYAKCARSKPMSEPVPASEFSRNFGRYKDQATADRVVEVSSNGRPIGAFLSQAEYEHYLRLKAR
jgi:prevent-host-death family protein